VNDQPHSFILLKTEQGLSISYEKENLIDKCDEGDILGLRPLLRIII
jgi:CBS domain-containing protein